MLVLTRAYATLVPGDGIRSLGGRHSAERSQRFAQEQGGSASRRDLYTMVGAASAYPSPHA